MRRRHRCVRVVASAWCTLAVTIVLTAGCRWLPGASDSASGPIEDNASPGAEGFPFRFQPFDTPELAELAARERLPDVVAPGRTEFERMIRLKNWVGEQWPAGTPNPYPPWNALIILDWIRAGKTGGFCAQFAQVFLQSLAALGMTARYIEIGNTENPYVHYLTEVWSNDFDKWVVMDPDFNLHFERDGIPLSALEVHDAFVGGSLERVHVVLGEVRAGRSAVSRWPHQTAELYTYLRYHLTADHLARPDAPPFERYNDMIELVDPRVAPWEASTVTSPFPKARLTRVRTSDRASLEKKLNQTRIAVAASRPDAVVLQLENDVLGFDHYEYRVVTPAGRADAWQSHRQDQLTVPAATGPRTIEVRGVNQRGVPGPAAELMMAAAR